MKVEEIKLAFESNVQFALIDDLKADLNKPFKNGTELEVLYNVELSNIKAKILKEYNTLISSAEIAKKTYQSFAEKAKEKGIKSVKLAVSGSFHSPLMQKASEKMAELLNTTTFKQNKLFLFCFVLLMTYPTKFREEENSSSSVNT